MSNELGILNDVVPGLSGVGVSAVDITAGLLRGRPYGGVAILWQKSLNYNIQCVYSGLDWLLAVSMSDDSHNLFTVVTVYLSCDCNENVNKYLDYLDKIQAFFLILA